MYRPLRLAAAAAAAIAVAACSSGGDSSGSAATGAPAGGNGSSAAGEDSATISIQNFVFGDPITVAPGTMIKVTNLDTAGHDVASDDAGRFKTPVLRKGESATFAAPSEPGTYKFSCTVHANMHGIGTLTVKG